MRERIDAPVSEFFEKQIIMPETIKDYDANFKDALLIQRAYAVMLTNTGIIDQQSGKRILEGLEHVGKALKRDNLNGELEDMYYNIEQTLVKKIGVKTGGKLHTGRSRNDIGSTLNRMELRKALFQIFDELLTLQELLLKKAKEDRDTVITGYTHMQPAQPITLGHYYTAVIQALNRDFTRLWAAYNNTNQCPYGAAAFAGASFPLDRQQLADLLGFDAVLENSLDCIASKDFLLETEMACVNMMITVSRVAQDQHFWCTEEFGLLDVGGQVAVCSSIMPQKKNPAGIEYAKSKAAHAIGALMGCISSLKNIPFSNSIDIHEALWLFGECAAETRKALGILGECFRFSHVDKDRALERAKNNFCTVTGLADYLVKNCGLSFEEAHHVVGEMVKESLDDGSKMAGMTARRLGEVSEQCLNNRVEAPEKEVRDALDPWRNIQSKVTMGGPSMDSVKRMIAEAEGKLSDEKRRVLEAKERVEEGYRKLEREEWNIRESSCVID